MILASTSARWIDRSRREHAGAARGRLGDPYAERERVDHRVGDAVALEHGDLGLELVAAEAAEQTRAAAGHGARDLIRDQAWPDSAFAFRSRCEGALRSCSAAWRRTPRARRRRTRRARRRARSARRRATRLARSRERDLAAVGWRRRKRGHGIARHGGERERQRVVDEIDAAGPVGSEHVRLKEIVETSSVSKVEQRHAPGARWCWRATPARSVTSCRLNSGTIGSKSTPLSQRIRFR